MMLVVGMDLSLKDFERVREFPRIVLFCTIGQLILLPLLGFTVAWLVEPAPIVLAGIILVAASPGGAISNYYVYLARANVALSVTLTATSTLIAFISLPLWIFLGFNLLLENDETIHLPVGMMVWQLFLLILLPIAIGMWLRHQIPGWVNKWAARFRQLTILALVLLILFITVVQSNNLLFHIRELVLTASLYTLAAMAIGWAMGHSLKLGTDDKFSLIVEFTVRNLALAIVVGSTFLENTELLTFTAAFFIIQVPLLLVSIYLQREQDLKRLPSK